MVNFLVSHNTKMKQKNIYYFFTLCLLGNSAHAETIYFHEKCPTLQKCFEFVGSLTSQKYIFPDSIGRQVIQSTKNVELSKENAELLLTNVLHQNGLTRLPIGQSNTYSIIELKDAPRQAVPLFSGDYEHKPVLPENWDVVTLKYKTRDALSASMIPRILQDYLPRTGSIMVTTAGYVLITDSAPNVARVMNVIDAFDQKNSPAMLKKVDGLKKSSASEKN